MDFYLRTLVLWEEAEAQGIDSSGGGHFGLDTKLFNGAQLKEYHRHGEWFYTRGRNGGHRPEQYNYFRYPDGKIIQLNPMLKAVHKEEGTA